MSNDHLAYTTPFPMGIEIASADGIYLFDKQGRKYTDLISGIAVSNLGHNNLEINEAITGVGTLSNRLAGDYEAKLRAARIADGQENPPHNIVPPGRYVEAHLGNTGLTNRRLRHSNT